MRFLGGVLYAFRRASQRASRRAATTDPHQTNIYMQDKPGSERDFRRKTAGLCLRGSQAKSLTLSRRVGLAGRAHRAHPGAGKCTPRSGGTGTPAPPVSPRTAPTGIARNRLILPLVLH